MSACRKTMSTCSIKIVQEPSDIILREYFFDENLLDEIKANYGVIVHSVPPKIVPPDIIHR